MNNEQVLKWDSDESIIELFGEPVSVSEKNETPKEEGKKETEEKKKEEVKEQEEPEVFSKTPEEAKDEEGEQETQEIINILREQGYISEDEDIDPTLDPLMYVVEKETEERLKQLLSDAPPIIKELVQYHAKGGNVYDYIESVVKQEVDVAKLNPDDAKDQERIIRQKLKMEGYDNEDIDQQIEIYKDMGKLGIYAKKFHKKMLEQSEMQKQQMLEEKRRQEELQRQKMIQFRNDIQQHVKKSKRVFDIPLNAKDIRELPDYVTNRNIKLDNGQLITRMQYDLMTALQDKEKTLFLAKLLRENFDLKNITKNLETKVTRNVKEKLIKNKTKPNGKVLSIADLFAD